jgi:hypothetical protein
MANTETRELSLSAELALLQEELHQARTGTQAADPITPGCRLAEELRSGDVFLVSGDIARDEAGRSIEVGGGMVIEMHPVTVLAGPEQDLTSDVFGRELIRFRVRCNRFGHEGNLSFGPGGVVRTETGPNFVLYGDLHPEGNR